MTGLFDRAPPGGHNEGAIENNEGAIANNEIPMSINEVYKENIEMTTPSSNLLHYLNVLKEIIR